MSNAVQEFFRGPMWPSVEVEDLWRPRLQSASLAWSIVEKESVRFGLRQSALLSVRAEEIPELSEWAADRELQLIILTQQPIGTGYSAGTPIDGPDGYRVVLTRGRTRDWHAAYAAGDDLRMGALLGYPECCRRFFSETWGRGCSDTALLQAVAAGSDGPPGANSLLRWLGVRLVPHLPCSFSCKETEKMSIRMFQIAEQAGVAAGLREAWHLLSMQMTYSALHGIGTIELPILKFEFSTDYTASEVRLLRKGLSGEAPTPAIPARASDPTSWEDNGFSSPDGMNGAHSTVAAAFGNTLNGFGPTLDLGCGDGALLERLRKRNGLERVVGVEVDEGRVSRGAKRFSEVDLWLGRIEDVNLWSGEEWQTIILMPGRLLEMKPPLADAFREALRRSAKRLLLYAYDDWAEGGLAALCVRAGLPPPSKIIKGHGRVVEAGV